MVCRPTLSPVNGSGPRHSDRVHQAQGMVSVQAGCSLDEALEKMKERAAKTGQSLEDLAAAVLDHKSIFGEGALTEQVAANPRGCTCRPGTPPVAAPLRDPWERRLMKA